MSDKEQGTGFLDKIDQGLAKAEAFTVVGVLTIMIVLSTLQLILHKFFESGIEWADIVVRQMVLWLGFVGGALATHEGRHIAIDAAGKFMSARLAITTRIITSTGAMIISGLMFYASIQFVKDEMESETTLFESIPAWVFEAIMPVALLAIMFHFFVTAYRSGMMATGRIPIVLERESSSIRDEEDESE